MVVGPRPLSPSSTHAWLWVPPLCSWSPEGDNTNGFLMTKHSAVTCFQHFVQSWASPVHWCSPESEGFGAGLTVAAYLWI